MIRAKNWTRAITVSLALLLLLVAGLAPAQGGVKEQMLERLPAITALKAQGLIGEDNRGFLTARGQVGDKGALVEAENNDRLAVYAAIAKQQNITPQLVGERRALKIAEIAVPGTWLQNSQGEWYKSK
jgi:uncharacterized protein YdbL (DUF1318 family)